MFPPPLRQDFANFKKPPAQRFKTSKTSKNFARALRALEFQRLLLAKKSKNPLRQDLEIQILKKKKKKRIPFKFMQIPTNNAVKIFK